MELEKCLPLLVVDLLLPGDMNGYVGRLISSIPKLSVLAFVVLGDEVAPPEVMNRVVPLVRRKNIVGLKVRPIGMPVYSQGQIDQMISNGGFHKKQASNITDSPRQLRFGPLELSTEFWQNVAELQILSGDSRGPEGRRLLFVENNEAVLKHQRLREQLQEFVENFIKNILELRLEVIVHPNHAIGAHIASLIARTLPSPPLVIPLSQWKYGGPVQVTANELRNIRERIDGFSRAKHRPHASVTPGNGGDSDELLPIPPSGPRPRCLIVDDSIITGNSIFTMLGIASQLDLKSVGVLVLINRLKPEISEAISWCQPNFGYFLRFHMPKLEAQEDPNGLILSINA